MKIKVLVGCAALAAISFLNSCKDDETPIAGISFELDEQEVTESDGTLKSFNPDDGIPNAEGRLIQAKLVFDRALAGDVVLNFDIDGTASKTATLTDPKDYDIEETGDNVTISGTKITITKGATEAYFSIRLYEDFMLEYDNTYPVNDDGIPYETVEISLTSVASGPAKLGDKTDHTIKILEDDGYVFLTWEDGTSGAVGDIDMDLIIYLDGDVGAISNYTNAEAEYELMTIPGGLGNATIGMSYVYKSGTSDQVNFTAEIANFGGTITKAGGATGQIFQYDGAYTTANLNNYNPDAPNTQIEQSFDKTALNYTNLTDITIPTSGSRTTSKNGRKGNFRLFDGKVNTLRIK